MNLQEENFINYVSKMNLHIEPYFLTDSDDGWIAQL